MIKNLLNLCSGYDNNHIPNTDDLSRSNINKNTYNDGLESESIPEKELINQSVERNVSFNEMLNNSRNKLAKAFPDVKETRSDEIVDPLFDEKPVVSLDLSHDSSNSNIFEKSNNILFREDVNSFSLGFSNINPLVSEVPNDNINLSLDSSIHIDNKLNIYEDNENPSSSNELDFSSNSNNENTLSIDVSSADYNNNAAIENHKLWVEIGDKLGQQASHISETISLVRDSNAELLTNVSSHEAALSRIMSVIENNREEQKEQRVRYLMIAGGCLILGFFGYKLLFNNGNNQNITVNIPAYHGLPFDSSSIISDSLNSNNSRDTSQLDLLKKLGPFGAIFWKNKLGKSRMLIGFLGIANLFMNKE